MDGGPIYGGTPADGSVIQALRAIAESGRKAVFYPFILMEQLAGNGLPNPWDGAADQPRMPWPRCQGIPSRPRPLDGG